MSRLRPEEEYKKTKSYKFFRWLKGEKDPYIDNVEMHVQSTKILEEKTIIERMHEKKHMMEEVNDLEHNRDLIVFKSFYRITCIVFCITLFFLLLITVSYLPPANSANNPSNNEVSGRYLSKTIEETGAVSAVTGMIIQYRGFDTFGETHVLFIATVCVMILLMVDNQKEKELANERDRKYEPRDDKILEHTCFVVIPIVFIFGFYVIVNGHISPGGGFSGGAIIGAGLILYASTYGFRKTQRFFNEHVYKIVKVSALIIYAAIMGTYFYFGANQIPLNVPLGEPGNILSAGFILPINILVGLEVACTMYAFFAMFRKGGL